LTNAIDGIRHVEEGFNQLMWETIHNGTKQFYFTTQWNKLVTKLADQGKLGKNVVNGIDLEILRGSKEIMETANNSFGGQIYSRLWKDPEFQLKLQPFMLSPDWTSSRLRGAANMLLNMDAVQAGVFSGAAGAVVELADKGFNIDEMTAKGFIGGAILGGVLNKWAQRINVRMGTRGDIMAREARRLNSSALLGGYFMANLLNRAFTGRWMFDNEEGDRLKIVLPDGARVGLGKQFLEPFEVTGGIEAFPIPVLSRLKSKLSPAINQTISILSNRSFFGPIFAADDEPWQLAGSAIKHFSRELTPITASGPARETAAIFSGIREPAEGVALGVLRASGINVAPPRRGPTGDRGGAFGRFVASQPQLGDLSGRILGR